MEKKVTVVNVGGNAIYFCIDGIDYSLDEGIDQDYICRWEYSEVLFNTLKKYQDEGYTIIFK